MDGKKLNWKKTKWSTALKKLLERLLFPPVWVILLLTGISAAALVWVFTKGLAETAVAYVVYVISFYAVTVAAVFLGMVLPGRYRMVREKVYENAVGHRYLTDIEFKNKVNLYCALAVNLLYAGLNGLLAWFYQTAWFGIFAVYYLILAVMRFLLVRYINQNRLGENRLLELHCARLCAAILTSLNLVLSGAVLMILFLNRGFHYYGILIYVMAMYTFYMTISAVRDLIRYRKYRNPVLSISKIIKMAASLVSVLQLETAMFASFGEEMSPESQKLMIALTGAGISLIVIGLASYVIVQTTSEIRELKSED